MKLIEGASVLKAFKNNDTPDYDELKALAPVYGDVYLITENGEEGFLLVATMEQFSHYSIDTGIWQILGNLTPMQFEVDESNQV